MPFDVLRGWQTFIAGFPFSRRCSRLCCSSASTKRNKAREGERRSDYNINSFNSLMINYVVIKRLNAINYEAELLISHQFTESQQREEEDAQQERARVHKTQANSRHHNFQSVLDKRKGTFAFHHSVRLSIKNVYRKTNFFRARES